MTVVETERFLKDVRLLLSDAERAELVAFIAENPEAGEVIPETGGVRKIRWALAGGKRGGARVIYYHHSERLPVFLLAAYAKNERANLSQAERNANEASGTDPGGWVCGEEIGGGNDYDNQNQAGGEEGGAHPEEAADRRCSNRRRTGAGHRVDPRRERQCPRHAGARA
jgi:hypothetical protein